ncbi:MAG: tetratricopeptide repeat protein [Pseudomonadota bacterium]
MAQTAWSKFPYADKAYVYAGASLKKHWARLHLGDCEPFPQDERLQEAWRLYHRGEFQQAAELGLSLGTAGYTVANKAQCIYATYLEKDDKRKLALFQEVAGRCEQQIKAQPENPNGYYFLAYSLGRYSQGISVAKALAQGLGGKIKDALTRALELQPRHADAHIAMGTYHAEVIDKVGAMVGGLTYGAKKDLGVEHFETALRLNPDSAIARIEYANGLAMMFGHARMKQAEKLYQEAAACKPMDAMERLDVELAKAEL